MEQYDWFWVIIWLMLLLLLLVPWDGNFCLLIFSHLAYFFRCNNLFDKFNILQWLSSSNTKNRVLIITTKYSPLITFPQHHPSKCKMKFYFLSFSIALIASSGNDDDRMRKISIQKKLLKIASTSISFPAISKSLSQSQVALPLSSQLLVNWIIFAALKL